jgi:hypothetical protein
MSAIPSMAPPLEPPRDLARHRSVGCPARNAFDGIRRFGHSVTDKGQDLFDVVIGPRRWRRHHTYEPGERSPPW